MGPDANAFLRSLLPFTYSCHGCGRIYHSDVLEPDSAPHLCSACLPLAPPPEQRCIRCRTTCNPGEILCAECEDVLECFSEMPARGRR